jgi:NAD(P)-dependent dehydrogenase (short-subunit alcohol dehydrogenase family)
MSDLFSLKDRTALVTGGGRGLGRAMAEGLADHGANVAIMDVDEASATRAAAELSSSGVRTLGIGADVTKRAEVSDAVERTISTLGAIDVLVNNAGLAVLAPAESVSMEDFQRTFEVDVFGLFSCSQVVFEHMAARTSGVIINIASMAGISVLTPQEHAAYNSAKAAVIMLTKSLAVEWAEFGIRVNAIAPGFMLTPPVELLRDEDPARWAEWMERVPLGRVGLPEELQGAAVYLASDASAYVTGATIVIDGGYTSL